MPIKILFKEEDTALFWKYWEELVNQNQMGPKYLPLSLESRVMSSKFKSLFHSDKSFVYLEDNRPMAGAFLPIEKKGKYLRISIMDFYIDAPILVNRAVEKKVFDIIDKIALDNKIGKIMLWLDHLDPISDKLNYNYLQEYGYLDTSILTYIIDLNIEDLFKSCRRNHRRNINFILNNKDFSVFTVNKENPSHAIHKDYISLHHKCSGKITRSEESFNTQFEKLKQGKSVLFGLKYKEKNIAYSYFDFNFGKALSYSAADDPDYQKFPLYHAIVFSAMEYLKKAGVKCIDMGQPSSPTSQLDYYPDKKQLNISLFKSGFGGYFKQNYRGIKYFSKDAFAEDAKQFANNYKIKNFNEAK